MSARETESMPDEELLTVDEAAQIMRVNPRTIRDYVNAGDLAVFMVGKREYRIRRATLNKFIQEREQRKGVE
jgi:excisionase family DNA binding protein